MRYFIYQLAALIDNPKDIGFDGPTSDSGIAHNILNAVYFWAGAVAVIIIIVGGFMYTTSNGDSGRMTKAKDAILGACIGLVVVILAFAITSIVLGSV